MKRETRSTCPYCGVGCGVIISAEGEQITGVRGDPDHPANFGRLCTKGSALALTASATVTSQTRLLQPLMRARRGQAATPLPWDDALDAATDRFAQIITAWGPDAVGFYVSGQLLTEDYYAFNKLAKGLIGTNNIDTNSRLCMSSAVAGYKQTLGADAPPSCYDDLRHAQCLFIVGSNTAYAHPVLFRRIEDAKAANPALKIIVCDPRRTDTAEIADLHLPLLPGTDVALFNGMLHLMLWEGWTQSGYIDAHTSGFEALKALVRDYTPDFVAGLCGLPKADLLEAARLFATSPATLSLYCQGLNQSTSGTAKNTALINLHLATGQIGKPGAGPFSLTGQPNAMGGREVGGLANLLSAHRDLANPVHRAEVAKLWGVQDVPAAPGKSAVEMFEAAADGQIKALWIACTNPAQSMPDQATVRRALERCEFVVLQEAFATTATADYADLLLPATTWGEKTGTVTNSERRISRVRPAVPPPGQARHDWAIAVDFARRLETRLLASPPSRRTAHQGGTLFPYALEDAQAGAEAIWYEHRESTRGRDLDITGLSYAMLEAGPRQWPWPEGATQGQARLYEDGVFPTPDGRARFVPTEYVPTAEPRESRYPFSLTTGRLRDQWHGMSRTGTLGRLFGHVAEPCIELNPQDLARLRLQQGDLVSVVSRRGRAVVPVQASEAVPPAQAFMGMHWGSEFLSGRDEDGSPLAGVNALTTSAFCPHSKQPELKHAAVRIEKAQLPWSLLAMAWLPQDRALLAHRRLSSLLPQFGFASCVPFADGAPLEQPEQQRHGVLLRAAGPQAATPALLAQVEDALGLAATDTLRYEDAQRGHRRSVRLQREEGQARLTGFLLAGDTRAGSWLRALLQDAQPVQAYGALLLQPGAQPHAAAPARGKPVCTCVGVTDVAIQEALQACGADSDHQDNLARLQGLLRCGTQCGSCLPEVRRMVRARSVARPATDSALSS